MNEKVEFLVLAVLYGSMLFAGISFYSLCSKNRDVDSRFEYPHMMFLKSHDFREEKRLLIYMRYSVSSLIRKTMATW